MHILNGLLYTNETLPTIWVCSQEEEGYATNVLQLNQITEHKRHSKLKENGTLAIVNPTCLLSTGTFNQEGICRSAHLVWQPLDLLILEHITSTLHMCSVPPHAKGLVPRLHYLTWCYTNSKQ